MIRNCELFPTVNEIFFIFDTFANSCHWWNRVVLLKGRESSLDNEDNLIYSWKFHRFASMLEWFFSKMYRQEKLYQYYPSFIIFSFISCSLWTCFILSRRWICILRILQSGAIQTDTRGMYFRWRKIVGFSHTRHKDWAASSSVSLHCSLANFLRGAIWFPRGPLRLL